MAVTAQVTRGQQLAIASQQSGFYRISLGELEDDPSKAVLTFAGKGWRRWL